MLLEVPKELCSRTW